MDGPWLAVFHEYGVQRSEECDSLDEALRFLFWGSDRNELAPDRVLAPDGTVAIEADSPEYDRREWEWIRKWEPRTHP